MTALPLTGIPPGTYNPNRWQPQKMAWWYWALMDAMVAEPSATKKDLARRFNISEVSFNLITTSDIFQAYLAERRAGNSRHLDEVIRAKATKVVNKTFDTIEEILDKKRDMIPLDTLIDLADKTLERLGYGVKNPSNNVILNGVQNNVVVPVQLQDLEAARAALRAAEGRIINAPGVVYDHLSPSLEREQPSHRGERSAESTEVLISDL